MNPNYYPKTLNQAFYNKHHRLIFKLLNNIFFGWLFRKLLKIRLPMKSKIAFLHPNGYSIYLGDANFRAELFHYDFISLRVYALFGWLFSAFHWFDMHIANPLVPSLNLGFDEYSAVSADIIVAGTVSKGYITGDGIYEFSTIRNAAGEHAASHNIMIACVRLVRGVYHLGWGHDYMSRGVISYNTSFLTYNDIVTLADLKLTLVHPVNYTSNLPNDKLCITAHQKVTSLAIEDNDLVPSDYNISMFGTVSFAEITWANYAAWSPVNYHFLLNQYGIDHIKRRAHTAFGLMVEMDMANMNPLEYMEEFPVADSETYYTIHIPDDSTSLSINYTSYENQIVMNM